MKPGIYDRYTSTTALRGAGLEEHMRWSASYYRYHYLCHLPADRNARILELGCGYGRFLWFLRNEGYANLSGFDISDEQTNTARSLGLDFVTKADILPYIKEVKSGLDVIISFDVFEHIEKDGLLEILGLAYKKLKPGGRLLIQVPNALSLFNAIRYTDITHVRSFTVSSLEQILLMSGFRKEDMTFIPLPPHVHGVKSLYRNIVWRFVVAPLIKGLFFLVNGEAMGGIYTPNIAVLAKK